MARRKARLRQQLHIALMNPVHKVTSHSRLSYLDSGTPGFDRRESVLLTCPNAAQAMGTYMALLEANTLSPWKSQYETDSFSAIINRALHMATTIRDDPSLFFDMCTRTRCSCAGMQWGDSVHMGRELESELNGVWKWKLWVCLDCLKEGVPQGQNRTSCRVKHW